jgi:hypothetical protein
MFLRRGPADVAVASSGLFQRNLHTTVRRGKAHSQNLRSDLQSIARPSTIDREIGLKAQARQWLQPCRSLLDFRQTQGENFAPSSGN